MSIRLPTKPSREFIVEVRPLAREDLVRLEQPRNRVDNYHNAPPKKMRDSHHLVARLFALGLRQSVVAQRTGYSQSRLSILRNSPAMDELIAHYRDKIDKQYEESVDDFFTLATGNMMKAERQLADKLDEADDLGETLPVRELIAISRDAADRFGYGKHTTSTNVNIDFAAEIEKRLSRVGNKAPATAPKTITGSATVLDMKAFAEPIRRRI